MLSVRQLCAAGHAANFRVAKSYPTRELVLHAEEETAQISRSIPHDSVQASAALSGLVLWAFDTLRVPEQWPLTSGSVRNA